MTSKIIEISGQNADYVSENNIYKITFDPPLENIQTLNLKQAFLDLRTLGNTASDTFILNEDIQASIEFCYYEQYLEQSSTTDGDLNARYDLRDGSFIKDDDKAEEFMFRHFVLCVFKVLTNAPSEPRANNDRQYDSIEILKNTFNFTIPAGTYSADSIVEFINDIIQQPNYGNDLFTSDSVVIPSTRNTIYTQWYDLCREYVEIGPTNNYDQFLGFVRIAEGGLYLDDLGNPLFQGYYYRQIHAPTQGASSTVSFTNTAAVMLGTPLFNLQNVNNLISFEYTHNPIYFNSNNGKIQQIQVGTYTKTTIFTYWKLRRGGVNIINLQPENFWGNILGFGDKFQLVIKKINIGAVTVLDSINLGGNNSFQSSSTRPFIGLADIDEYVNKGTNENTTIFDPTQTAFNAITVNNTLPIKADNIIQFADLNNGGHYLLDLQCGYNINNYIDSKTYKNLSCIMSREYLNNGFLSIFEGQTNIILDINSKISTITITVIDPLTKKPALNLGAANSFYFEVS
jgi:hypothetical protein